MTKKTQNKLRKALLLVCSAMLLVSITVVGTVAYLTAQTETVINAFTVGNVSFADAALDEAKVTEYGVIDGTTRVTANTYKLIPGHTYVKDPTVHMSDNTEDAWLFVKVTNDIIGIEKDVVITTTTTNEDGTTTETTVEYGTIADQMTANGWALVEGTTNVYAYKETVSAGDDIVVFEYFALENEADVSTYASKTITVEAYAVQADGFASAAAAWKAAPLADWTNDATTGA